MDRGTTVGELISMIDAEVSVVNSADEGKSRSLDDSGGPVAAPLASNGMAQDAGGAGGSVGSID